MQQQLFASHAGGAAEGPFNACCIAKEISYMHASKDTFYHSG